MLTIEDLLKVLNSYNINSNKYGPTIYQNNNELGICLDIKDSIYGFLTRAFIFQTKEEANEFLKKYFWFKNNQDTYNIKLSLKDYDTKTTDIVYTYNDKELSLDDMLNLKETISLQTEQKKEDDTKNIYLANIKELTDYLINIKDKKIQNKETKNNLKIKENDLKHELLEALSLYYGKNKEIPKKAVSLESIITNNDKELLENNLKNIEDKSLTEIKNYLLSLIDITKTEELDEKNLINIYSNSIYKYNIEILNKQIEFVKNKIESEKKFNLKGSKIHNIDEELKSFLKTNITPIKVEVFLEQTKKEITDKYSKITDIKNASFLISGKNITATPSNLVISSQADFKKLDLHTSFNSLPNNTKASLILYNSLYKNICNYIIDNNYPTIDNIKNAFDFTYYYNELEEIIYNENNSHYLINYFKNINFKTIDTYINSLIEICKTVEQTNFLLTSNIKAFGLKDNHVYKSLSLTALTNANNDIYLLDIPTNTKVLYIPEKLELDDETKEISSISTSSIYIKSLITGTDNVFYLNIYDKICEKYNNSDIIITTDLILNKQVIFHIGNLKGGISYE